MAIDLLDLLQKNMAIAGGDPTFSGLVAPKATTANATQPQTTEQGEGLSTPTSEFQGSIGQFASLLGNVAMGGLGLMGLGSAVGAVPSVLAGKQLGTNLMDVLSYDPNATKNKTATAIDQALRSLGISIDGHSLSPGGLAVAEGGVETLSTENLAAFSDALFGDSGASGISPENLAAFTEALFGSSPQTDDSFTGITTDASGTSYGGYGDQAF